MMRNNAFGTCLNKQITKTRKHENTKDIARIERPSGAGDRAQRINFLFVLSLFRVFVISSRR
jgi:hypothetical protein